MKKIKIEIFSSPGCSKCKQARKVLQKIVENFEGEPFIWSEINTLTDLDYAIEKGIMSTPSILIDGKLVFNFLPSPSQLKKYLQEQLEKIQ